jgi:HPt (histidine-containing phosphotransfer) domain-containing protein
MFPILDTSERLSHDSLPKADDGVPLDMPELLERCMGSAALAQRLVTSFRSRMEEAAAALECAIRDQDADTLAKVAHQLKGSAANISAASLQRLLGQLEELAGDGRIEEASESMTQVRRALDKFNAYCANLPPQISAQSPLTR